MNSPGAPHMQAPTSPWRGEVDGRRPSGGGELAASPPTPPRLPPIKSGVGDPPPPGEGEERERACAAAASVCDPEIPVLSIADLGVLRDVRIDDGMVEADHHADLFRLPGDEHDRARNRAGAGEGRLRQAQGHDRAVAGLDHRLDDARPARPSCANTASRRRRRRPDAARCSARTRSPVRIAARPTRHASPNSARPPARRCGAARPAPSRSTISNASEDPMAVEFHRLKIADVRRETPEAVSIAFAVPRELHGGLSLPSRPAPDAAYAKSTAPRCGGPIRSASRLMTANCASP